MSLAGQKRKRSSSGNILPTPQPQHPYLSGNFAPIHQTLPLTLCTFVGRIPEELAGGEYVRNGSNPVSNADLGRDAHWFDGDGMLSGVSFARSRDTGEIVPEFVNQFALTDVYLSAISSPRLRVPILPSIATLVNPLASFVWVTLRILRTVLLVILSHLPGSKHAIKRISVANTSMVFHDGRALATCESGPPLRIQLPGLETVGWYDGVSAEGEPEKEKDADARALGGEGGLISFMREWTTAHPKIDPVSQEMLMFHSSFAPPYVQYSIIPSQSQQRPSPLALISEKTTSPAQPPLPKLLNAPVPGITSAKMMHDFGCSRTHTVILDLPLSLDPVNQLCGLPPVAYDASRPSRFGVFPRREPARVTWFETDASCIFHTANTWDDVDTRSGRTTAVNMLACRLTSATLVFAAGNIAPPVERSARPAVTSQAAGRRKRMPFLSKYDGEEDKSLFDRSAHVESPLEEKQSLLLRPSLPTNTTTDTAITSSASDDDAATDVAALADFLATEQCRLSYYAFDLGSGTLAHQWALTAIPFEFPSVRPDREMQAAQFIYGCSTTSAAAFGAALGKATKIDALVKIDARTLIARGRAHPPRAVEGVVDARSMREILANGGVDAEGRPDPVRVFRLPEGWCAQEPRFVPAKAMPAWSASRSSTPASCSDSDGAADKGEKSEDHDDAEDAGYLLFYAFDESQLQPDGSVPDDADPEKRARSELWILDARNMRDVLCRVSLPQRVPYGLHGAWFGRECVEGQRQVERVRSAEAAVDAVQGKESGRIWMRVRVWLEWWLG